MATRDEALPEIRIGGTTIRPAACEVVSGSARIVLEPQVMKVLATLAGNAGAVVSRDQLVSVCWDGRSVSEDAINRVVSRIRKLAAETGSFELQTQRKVGYRLCALPADMMALPTSSGPTRLPISIRIVGLLVLLLAIGGLIFWLRGSSTADGTQSIVVSVAPERPQEEDQSLHFAAEIRQSLARIRGLRPLSSPSAETSDLLLEVSNSSGVGRPILVTLKKIDTGATVWSGRFSRSLDLLPVQQRAIAAVVRYLAVYMSDRLDGGAVHREPEMPEVSRLAMEGMRAWQSANEERQRHNMAVAARLYQTASTKADQALALDPQSPKALMLRFQSDQLPTYPRPDETRVAFEQRKLRAAEMLTRALVADPDDAGVLVAAAQVFIASLDWSAGGALLCRAVKLEPGSPDANSWLAFHLALLGRCDEGLQYARRGIALDPGSFWRKRAIPRLLMCRGDKTAALQNYNRLLSLEPTNSALAREAYLAALATGREDLLSLAASIRSEQPRGRSTAGMILIAERAEAAALSATAPLQLERKVDADMLSLSRNAHSVPGPNEGDILFGLAYEYATVGATSKALQALTRAHDAGSTFLPWALPFGSSEFPRPLRSNAKYLALWQNLPAWAELMRIRKRNSRSPAASITDELNSRQQSFSSITTCSPEKDQACTRPLA